MSTLIEPSTRPPVGPQPHYHTNGLGLLRVWQPGLYGANRSWGQGGDAEKEAKEEGKQGGVKATLQEKDFLKRNKSEIG